MSSPRLDAPPARAGAVILLQAVSQDDLVARLVTREIDDHVVALRHRHGQGVELEGDRQEVPVVGEDDEGLLGAQVELVESRWPAIDDAKAVFARLDLEIRLDDPVDRELVAENAVDVEDIEDRPAGLVEQHVVQHERHVEPPARQAPRCWPGIVLVARVLLVVEGEEEGAEPGIDVGRGEIHAVIVIPHGAEALARVEPGREHGVVMVPVFAGINEIERESIAFRRRMHVVEMHRRRRQPEPHMVGRQLIEPADEKRLTVARMVCKTRNIRIVAEARRGRELRVVLCR